MFNFLLWMVYFGFVHLSRFEALLIKCDAGVRLFLVSITTVCLNGCVYFLSFLWLRGIAVHLCSCAFSFDKMSLLPFFYAGFLFYSDDQAISSGSSSSQSWKEKKLLSNANAPNETERCGCTFVAKLSQFLYILPRAVT